MNANEPVSDKELLKDSDFGRLHHLQTSLANQWSRLRNEVRSLREENQRLRWLQHEIIRQCELSGLRVTITNDPPSGFQIKTQRIPQF